MADEGNVLHDGSVSVNTVWSVVICEQGATQEKSLFLEKPLYTRSLVKITNCFHGSVK